MLEKCIEKEINGDEHVGGGVGVEEKGMDDFDDDDDDGDVSIHS